MKEKIAVREWNAALNSVFAIVLITFLAAGETLRLIAKLTELSGAIYYLIVFLAINDFIFVNYYTGIVNSYYTEKTAFMRKFQRMVFFYNVNRKNWIFTISLMTFFFYWYFLMMTGVPNCLKNVFSKNLVGCFIVTEQVKSEK